MPIRRTFGRAFRSQEEAGSDFVILPGPQRHWKTLLPSRKLTKNVENPHGFRMIFRRF